MEIVRAIGHAAATAGAMSWQILWALVLGFYLSAVVEALVSKESIARLMGDHRPRSLAIATGLGAASSSCSYVAVALARSLFRKGGDFTAAMVFELASTNLVIELGIIMAVLLGWQFTLAEFVGGPVMILILALAFRLFVSKKLVADAQIQADRGVAGRMEGHATMDMSVAGDGSLWRRLLTRQGFTATSHIYVMNWASVLVDIVGGLAIAGALAAWVPDSFWRHLFFAGHPLAAKIWGPIVGPAISVVAFVCSIGNVPLAAVLWNGGISFGGVVAFIFADLIVFPILVIYRKYYGTRMALRLFAPFLRHHDRSGLRHRIDVPATRPHPIHPHRQSPLPPHLLEQRHLPQHCRPCPQCRSPGPILPLWGPIDAGHDGRIARPRRSHGHNRHGHDCTNTDEADGRARPRRVASLPPSPASSTNLLSTPCTQTSMSLVPRVETKKLTTFSA
jgi:uncharacterized membrane protein YraQ (UPF0718 family)